MAYNARVFRVLIASPNDVDEERKIISHVIQEWNDLNSYEKRVVLLPLMWETHSSPELGDRPQAIINRQVVDLCDMLVGVFWTRIGTSTGKSASGTIEEIERIGKEGKIIMLYFSKIKVELDSVDLDQYRKLKDFKYRTYPEGLVESFSSVLEFRDKFSRQLAMKIKELVNRDTEGRDSDAIDTRQKNPQLRLFLMNISGDQLVDPAGKVEIERVVCKDIEKIKDTIEKNVKDKNKKLSDDEREYFKNKADYFYKLIQYYCTETMFNSFRLAVTNIENIGLHDLIMEATLNDCNGNLRLVGRDNEPLKPQPPVNPKDEQSFFVHSGSSIIYNVHQFNSGDIKIIDSEAGWELKFEVPVIQAQRTVVSNSKFQIGATDSCTAEFKATVFSSQAPPFKLRSKFDFIVSVKEMGYKEILGKLGEDISELKN